MCNFIYFVRTFFLFWLPYSVVCFYFAALAIWAGGGGEGHSSYMTWTQANSSGRFLWFVNCLAITWKTRLEPNDLTSHSGYIWKSSFVNIEYLLFFYVVFAVNLATSQTQANVALLRKCRTFGFKDYLFDKMEKQIIATCNLCDLKIRERWNISSWTSKFT